MVDSLLRRYLDMAAGITATSRERAEALVDELVQTGTLATGIDVQAAVDDLLDRQRRNRDVVATLARSEVQRAVRSAGVATDEEVERLSRQVDDLRRRVAALEARADPQEPS